MRYTKQICALDFFEERNAIHESVLLAVLNLGKDLRVPYGQKNIEASMSKEPEDWTPEVQYRVNGLCRMAISIVEKLQALPPFSSLNEAVSREELIKPLNDAFAYCLTSPHVQLDLSEGKSFRVGERIIAGVFRNQVESAAMLGLRDLLKRGELGKLRECGNASCGTWFIAQRTDRKWCSTTCRHSMFQRTSEFKEQRSKNYFTKTYGPRIGKERLALLKSKRKKSANAKE